MMTTSSRTWPSAVCLALLTIGFMVPESRGEMRKSWQSKGAVLPTQHLKAARLEEPPSAKPPEVDPTPQPTNVNEPGQMLKAARAVPAAGKPPVQFSSRVRNTPNGVLKPMVVQAIPIDEGTASPEGSDRAEALHLGPNLDEVQVDDATVQDDEDEEDDDDDDDDEDENSLLGWGSQAAGKHGKEFDLIGNILEEVAEQRESSPEAESPAAPSGDPNEKEERVKDYTFPPVLNMTIDEPNRIVRVKLNQDVVRDMLTTGRQGGGAGGKKMLRYILPLFILPFLIQSAVIPFMLTAVKLFLLKSLMAGKVAIFLLLLGAFKNFTKKESRDVYVKDVPDRRYEPSSEGFAYLAEGRPSSWIN